MARKDIARSRAARLAGRGFPLAGNKRLKPGVFGETPEIAGFDLIKETPPTGGEYAAVDAAAARRAARRRTR